MVGIRGLTGRLSTVIGSPDPRVLARFYSALLGWDTTVDEPDWVIISSKDAVGPTVGKLSFQREVDHRRPVWPSGPEDQQMQFHLDIGVDDLASAVADAVILGAVEAEVQPQEDVRVLLDPNGHPFCLYLDR